MSQFVDFPKPETISSGERARRLTLEVERLARLPTVEWMFYLDDTAKAHGITANKLKVMVTAIIKEAEEAKAEAENKAREARADREAASEDLRALPRAEHEAGLARLAARLGADLGDLRDEFAIFAGLADEKEAACEPWPEPVDTRKLINDIMAKLRRYVVVNDDIAIATTLWGMMTWIHNDLAVHSPLLVFHSSTENSGKTTICGVLKYLAPSWKSAAEMTGPTLFRIVDYFRPMLVIEEADELLTRRKDLMHIINSGWTRGTKIPRIVKGKIHEFDPFCPKVINGKRLKLDSTTASRSIICRMVPRLASEKVEKFHQVDDDDFQTLRLQLERWSKDNLDTLRNAEPVMPDGFISRLEDNWKWLLAIADMGGLGKRARAAAVRLSRRPKQPDDSRQLLEAVYQAGRIKFADRKYFTSAEMVEHLLQDENANWSVFRDGKPLTKWSLADVLREDFDVHPNKNPVRVFGRASEPERGYAWTSFDDAFRRYLHHLPPLPITSKE
jgi:hypothetical protein